ncbi:MAG TPA: hypothetical protein VMG99_08925 [Thermoplasmata archaeon]|nr:hypothetical protein [Thermoplasmata archaeon]
MSEPAWKKVERRIAEFFGTERNPLSGGNSKHSRSDSLHLTLFIETKHGRGCPVTWPEIRKLFASVEALAAAEHKTALLVLHSKRTANVAQYDAYLRLFPNRGPSSIVVCVPLEAARDYLHQEAEAGRVLPPPTVTLDSFAKEGKKGLSSRAAGPATSPPARAPGPSSPERSRSGGTTARP